MNILFVFPTHLDRQGRPIKYRYAYMPPLSLAILDSLTPKMHATRVINELVEPIDFSIDYDLVAITMGTYQAPRAYQLADHFRRKGARVILGGIHASALPEEAAGHADAIVVGEAEPLWEQILVDCERSRLQPLYQCKEFPSLDQAVIPRWEAFNFNIYRQTWGTGKARWPRLPLFTTRGCVFNCTYCSVSKFFGRSYRFKPIAKVLEEIASTDADHYLLIDDNITCNADYARELFTALASKHIRWVSQTSIHILNHPHLIELAAKAGCRDMIVGIESIDKQSLKKIKKGFNNPDKYIELFRRMEAVGIKPLVSMIYGLDDMGDFNETLRFLKKARVWYLLLWLLTPLPGTELFNELDSAGRIHEKDWSRYDLTSAVFQPLNGMPPQELEAEYWRINRNFFKLSNIGGRVIRHLVNPSRPLKEIVNDIKFELHFLNQVKNFNAPISMGLQPLNPRK